MAFDANSYKQEFNRRNYDTIMFQPPKGSKDKLKALAKQEGVSVNELLRRALLTAYGLDLSK